MRLLRSTAFAAIVICAPLAALSPAQAAPNPDNKLVVTAGCALVDGGETFFVDVIPQGAVAFIVDENGDPTGEKLHLLSLDAAGFNQSGQLVFEEHKTYGNRTGHDEVVFCSGSFDAGGGVTVFFDVLATIN